MKGEGKRGWRVELTTFCRCAATRVMAQRSEKAKTSWQHRQGTAHQHCMNVSQQSIKVRVCVCVCVCVCV